MHRYRARAIRTASERNIHRIETNASERLTPIPSDAKLTKNDEAGGLSIKGGGEAIPSAVSPGDLRDGGIQLVRDLDAAGPIEGGIHTGSTEKATRNAEADATLQAAPPPAPPPFKSEQSSNEDPTMTVSDNHDQNNSNAKPPMTTRMKAGRKRFVVHLKNAVCHSWINVLLVAVPAGIAVEVAGLNASVIFAVNAVAIVPLAGMLALATEAVAARLGDTMGALLNVSFGNAVELIIFIIALVKNEIRIVQASLLGSILANLLLILGMAFLLGGLRYREQVYNSTVTQMSACLLSLSVMSLLLPTAFHASFNEENLANADTSVLKVSRGTSVVLLLVYILYLLFQLKSHAYMYESTPQAVIDEESHPGVLHDMMMSSSSSDSSSSSSSSSSDSDGSGSVATTTKRVKRMFKHRKRRKSSASTSTSATNSGLASAMSSPSDGAEKPTTDYFRDPSVPSSRRGSTLAAIASGDEADVEKDERGHPRVFDWATRQHSNDDSKPPELVKKRKSKRSKRREKKRRQAEEAEMDKVTTEPDYAEAKGPPKVAFSDDVQTTEIEPTSSQAQSKLGALNMRGLSARTRPLLPSYLSNTVFSSQQNGPDSAVPSRPAMLGRPVSTAGLRRASSLPDRLRKEYTTSQPTNNRSSGLLYPYQHKPQKTASGASSGLPVPSAAPEEDEDDKPEMSRTAAVVLLLISTGLVAACAEFMVDAIPVMVENSPVGEAFIGLIILPIVGNAAEHVTAVTVAAKNKMDLAIGVAVGSSIQIALFVTPVVVLLGWILDTNMSLYFNLFETISLFVTAFVVNFLVLDGRSNYLEGSLLIAAYTIIALAAFFYPATSAQSAVGGGAGDA